jgi:hypothetical protein
MRTPVLHHDSWYDHRVVLQGVGTEVADGTNYVTMEIHVSNTSRIVVIIR